MIDCFPFCMTFASTFNLRHYTEGHVKGRGKDKEYSTSDYSTSEYADFERSGRGDVKNKHSTDTESPPPPPRVRMNIHPGVKLSVGVTCHAYLLEFEGLFTHGSRHGRTVGESVGGILEMDSSDWSNGIQ